jgi:integrase
MILTEAASAASDRDFDAYIKVGEQFCRDKGKKKTARAATTFGKLAEQWTDGTLTREHPDHVGTKKTADHDVSRLETICAVPVAPGLRFGDLPLASVTLDHCETATRNLPDSAKRPATRRHYAQVIHRVLALAVFPCRLIAASPLPRGFLPRTGKPPAYPYLYPGEDAKLLAHTAIPLGRRLLWGFLAREGCRSGEATSLTVGTDVDLERGVVRLDKNKTDDPRAWAMDPGVAAALRAYVERRKAKRGAPLFAEDDGQPIDVSSLAGQLRADLEAAGVDRAELFEGGENWGKLRAHDLRGTFVTLSLANGKSEAWIGDRTGHRSSIMINRYKRSARTAAELGLGPLHPLDAAIPELAPPKQGGPKGGPRRRRGAPQARRSGSKSSLVTAVAPPGLEPGRYFYRGILNPLRLPFRQGAGGSAGSMSCPAPARTTNVAALHSGRDARVRPRRRGAFPAAKAFRARLTAHFGGSSTRQPAHMLSPIGPVSHCSGSWTTASPQKGPSTQPTSHSP